MSEDDRLSDLILRTVYLPKEVDRELKAVAFRSERSKNALIRDLIVEAIKARRERGDPLFSDTPRRDPVTVAQVKPRRVSAAKGTAARKTSGRKAAEG